MGLKRRLIKKGNTLDKLAKQIHTINGESVEVGHYETQGLHPSGFTYPELMAIHHTGNPEDNLPARPVLSILAFRMFSPNRVKDPVIRRAITKWLKGPIAPSSNINMLNSIGRELVRKEKAIFGSGVLVKNAPRTISIKGSNSPLIDTGDLRDHTSYKTSIDDKVKGG